MIWLLIALALLVGVTQWRAAARERAVETAYPPPGQFIDVGGTKIHAEVRGSGPDLILLHGANGSTRDFTFDLADRLATDYRVIMFDRPGLGWSDRLSAYKGIFNAAGEPPLEQAAVLQQAADILGVKDPIVVGQSFGGVVALGWGLNRPDQTSAIVLISAVSKPWPGELGWTYTVPGTSLGSAFFVPLATAFVPQSMVDGSLESVFAPDAVPEGYAAHIGPALNLRRTTLRANTQQVNGLRPNIVKMQTRYDTLAMPVEVIHGTADTIVPLEIHSRPLMDDLPNASLSTLEGVGHMPHHTHTQDILDAIERAATRAGLR